MSTNRAVQAGKAGPSNSHGACSVRTYHIIICGFVEIEEASSFIIMSTLRVIPQVQTFRRAPLFSYQDNRMLARLVELRQALVSYQDHHMIA